MDETDHAKESAALMAHFIATARPLIRTYSSAAQKSSGRLRRVPLTYIRNGTVTGLLSHPIDVPPGASARRSRQAAPSVASPQPPTPCYKPTDGHCDYTEQSP